MIEIGNKMNLDYMKPAYIQSTVFEDNNGCLTVANAPQMTPRTKHIAVKYHWFKSHLSTPEKDKDSDLKGIWLKRVDTDLQKADIFTKGLEEKKFVTIRKLVMGW